MGKSEWILSIFRCGVTSEPLTNGSPSQHEPGNVTNIDFDDVPLNNGRYETNTDQPSKSTVFTSLAKTIRDKKKRLNKISEGDISNVTQKIISTTPTTSEIDPLRGLPTASISDPDLQKLVTVGAGLIQRLYTT